jgi:hypothetical protein
MKISKSGCPKEQKSQEPTRYERCFSGRSAFGFGELVEGLRESRHPGATVYLVATVKRAPVELGPTVTAS